MLYVIQYSKNALCNIVIQTVCLLPSPLNRLSANERQQ